MGTIARMLHAAVAGRAINRRRPVSIGRFKRFRLRTKGDQARKLLVDTSVRTDGADI